MEVLFSIRPTPSNFLIYWPNIWPIKIVIFKSRGNSKNGKRFSFVASNVGIYLMLLFSSVKRVEIIVKRCARYYVVIST